VSTKTRRQDLRTTRFVGVNVGVKVGMPQSSRDGDFGDEYEEEERLRFI